MVIDGVSLIANYRSQFTRVQGVFQSLEAAAHLAEQFRRDGATISETWLTDDAGNRVGVRARVRVGPFADRSDALSIHRRGPRLTSFASLPLFPFRS